MISDIILDPENKERQDPDKEYNEKVVAGVSATIIQYLLNRGEEVSIEDLREYTPNPFFWMLGLNGELKRKSEIVRVKKIIKPEDYLYKLFQVGECEEDFLTDQWFKEIYFTEGHTTIGWGFEEKKKKIIGSKEAKALEYLAQRYDLKRNIQNKEIQEATGWERERVIFHMKELRGVLRLNSGYFRLYINEEGEEYKLADPNAECLKSNIQIKGNMRHCDLSFSEEFTSARVGDKIYSGGKARFIGALIAYSKDGKNLPEYVVPEITGWSSDLTTCYANISIMRKQISENSRQVNMKMVKECGEKYCVLVEK